MPPTPCKQKSCGVGILQVVLDQEDFHSVHCISTHGSLPPLTSMSMSIETFRGWIPTVLYYRKQKSQRGGTPVFDQSAYSSTNLPAEPSCSSFSLPTTLLEIVWHEIGNSIARGADADQLPARDQLLEVDLLACCAAMFINACAGMLKLPDDPCDLWIDST